ncbi:MAG: hypothetical protein R6U55_03195 [Desulfovermiculus sp.]
MHIQSVVSGYLAGMKTCPSSIIPAKRPVMIKNSKVMVALAPEPDKCLVTKAEKSTPRGRK